MGRTNKAKRAESRVCVDVGATIICRQHECFGVLLKNGEDHGSESVAEVVERSIYI